MWVKKFFIILNLIICTLMFGCIQGTNKVKKEPTILIVGDSLSAAYQLPADKGWVKLISNDLLEKGLNHKIINLSVNGATTADALKSIEAGRYYDIDILVLAVGANDALQRLDPQTSYDNINKIIQNIETKSNPQVLLVNLSPPKQLGVFGLGMFQYRKIYTQMRDQHDPYYYIDNLMSGLDNSHFLTDMIHPNAAGQIIMKDNVLPMLEKIIDKNYTQ